MYKFIKTLPLFSKPYWFARKNYWKFEFNRNLSTYIEENSVKRLQVGCSINVLDNWFNVDIIPFYKDSFYMDATVNFPISNNTFDYIFSEHMIEHIDYKQGWHMLNECYRVLKPNGKIRVSTPDLKKLVDLFDSEKTSEQKEYINSVIRTWRPEVESPEEGYVVNLVFGFDHQFIYDENTLSIALRKAGFSNIKVMNPRETQYAEFSGIDVHVNDYIEFETLVIEAEKSND